MLNKTSAFCLIGILWISVTACKSQSVPLVESWEVGSSTGMFDDFSREEFVAFGRNGIKYIELGSWLLSDKTDDEIVSWVSDFKEKTDQAGMQVWSVHLPFSRALDISTANDEDRNNTIQGHLKLMALLSPLNIQKYVVHASAEPIEDEERAARIRNSIASLKILTEEVKKHDAQLALEVLPRTCLANTADEFLRIVNEVGNGLEVCFDSNHLLQETPEAFVASVGSLITTVHISDYDRDDEKHWLPGTGLINWTNVISELVNMGYEGPWMYEVSRGGGRGRDENLTSKHLVDNWLQLKADYLRSGR